MKGNIPVDTLSMKKPKDEVTGFNVRILDDGSFILRTDNSDYSKCEELSFQNIDELNKGIKKVLGKIDKDSEDELSKKD